MHTLRYLLAMVFLGLSLASAQAEGEHATREEAIAMVKQAVADIKTDGNATTFAAISNPHGKYVKADLYLVAYGMDGKCLAHGQSPALVGMNLIGLRDVDGKAFVQERVELAAKQQSFWHDYMYMSPTTHTILPKQSYCERSGDAVICGGIYK